MKENKYTKAAYRLVEDIFIINAVYIKENEMEFSLTSRFDEEKSLKLLEDRLKLAGYNYKLYYNDNEIVLTLDPKATFKIPLINKILFMVTLLSVYFVPVFYDKIMNLDQAEYFSNPENRNMIINFFTSLSAYLSDAFSDTLADLATGTGIVFTVAMISILFVHEMGHYIASRRRNIITSYPYFIPAPNIIGTFGAVIKSKSPFYNRRDLLEVGAAGPIAGWIVAVAWLAFGLTQSELKPIEEFASSNFSLSVGPSLISHYLANWIVGEIPTGYVYTLSEAAFAGWVGLLVTAINMLPIGMLDGGHVTYGLIRGQQKYIGFAAMALLLLLGLFSPMWWLFAIFGLIFGIKHPPTLRDNLEPTRASVIMGISSIIILILSFTPIPIQ